MQEKKIKVIHLLADLGIGGTQKVVLDICSSMDLAKYEVAIYLLNDHVDLLATYNLPEEISIKKFSYQYADDYSLKSYFKLSYFKNIIHKKAKEIINSIVSDAPDILHLHTHPMELTIGILVQKRIKCMLVFTQHFIRLYPESLSLKLLGVISRYNYRKYHLIAVSEAVENEIKTHKLLGRKNTLTLIENKLNLKLFRPSKKESSEYISVVYVARIGHPKGHAELIKAWSMLQSLKIKKRLFLVGPDSLNNQVHELAEELVKDGSVIFTGSEFDIASILRQCDFAVFPSFKEGLPIALLEKMAMELPVIVSDIEELTNIVIDNLNGLVFKCGDPEDLAKKITVLLKDPELVARLGKKARETVELRFGSENIAKPNEKVYERILK